MPRCSSKAPSRKPGGDVEVVGARTHNLKNVSLTVRRGRLTVVTGVSGSGKSSLAFDTLYAEGQRRYVESMSTYARQFLERMQRPDVDAVHNIPPAIALEQKNHVTNARSTIGTATEINDFLRLLFARVGHVICPDCGEEVVKDSPQSALETLAALEDGRRLLILAPVETPPPADGETPWDVAAPIIEEMRRQGFARALTADGALVDLETFNEAHLEGGADGRVDLVADRVRTGPRARSRIGEALELAFRAGGGRVRVRDADTGAEWIFSSDLSCNRCGRQFRRPEPALFSFSSPLGACPDCQGFGRVTGIDMEKVIPNETLTLEDRPVAPWNTPANEGCYDDLAERAPGLPWDVPIADFTPEQRRLLVEGDRRDGGRWYGIQGFFRWLEGRRYKIQARVMLARFRAYTTCPACDGTRLVPEALHVRVDGRTIAEVCAQSIEDLHEYFDLLRLPKAEMQAAERLLGEIRSRLKYLHGVGLGYLTLARQTRTLSGGESQRINLAAALGSALTDTLYVLDEPTVGLHSRDSLRLLAVLHALRENGNTLVVVEHDPDIILGADDVVDVGPAAGEHGGELLYAGPLKGLARSKDSITARFLAQDGARSPLPSRRRSPKGWITLRGARENNLKNLDVRFPRGVLCCVTGVSGSGKSTLVESVLYAGLRHDAMTRKGASSTGGKTPLEVGRHDRIDGAAALAEVMLVDQRPIGRSTRSNPVTYVKAYDEIRKLFAGTREARRDGVRAGDFSFNVEGGRCETCQGAGVVTVDMHFLADVEVVCEDCGGTRFMRRVLNIEYQGRNIDQVLELTVDEARAFFAGEPKVLRRLEPLVEVGLGYLRLGQSTATLSGGEAQRLKLAGFLAGERPDGGKRVKGETLMIFDEPTTGLHASDVERLAALFHALVERGTTVLVVEHNLDLVAHADWIVDLGPEGGDEGGRVVAEGPPAKIAACGASWTGRYLKERFAF